MASLTPSRLWDPAERGLAYRELEHPADLWLEIWGKDVDQLFENALFALYDELAELTGFEPREQVTLTGAGSDLAQALRELLAEALYRFDTERFVARAGRVRVTANQQVDAVAVLWGEKAHPARHVLTTEIKAVTYHLLAVEKRPEGDPGGDWRATVLFDI